MRNQRCLPCTTCDIKECKKNRNSNPKRTTRPMIEQHKDIEQFRNSGCPYKK